MTANSNVAAKAATHKTLGAEGRPLTGESSKSAGIKARATCGGMDVGLLEEDISDEVRGDAGRGERALKGGESRVLELVAGRGGISAGRNG